MHWVLVLGWAAGVSRSSLVSIIIAHYKHIYLHIRHYTSVSVKTGEIFLEFYSVYDNKLHLITVELKASQTDLSKSYVVVQTLKSKMKSFVTI